MNRPKPQAPQPNLEERAATLPRDAKKPRVYLNAFDFEISHGDKPIEGRNNQELYPADLWTNETFDPGAAKQVSDLINPRYIMGVGFGNILVHASLCSHLEGIVCMDTLPKVISLGRATRHLLQEIGDAEKFIGVVLSGSELPKALDGIELKEREYVLRILLERVKYKDPHHGEIRTEEDFLALLRGGYTPFRVTRLSADVLAVLLQNYNFFRGLATQGRIGILEGNITDENTLKQLRNLNRYHQSNSLIYLSNIPYRMRDMFGTMRRMGELAKPFEGEAVFVRTVHFDGLEYSIHSQVDGNPFSYNIVLRDDTAHNTAYRDYSHYAALRDGLWTGLSFGDLQVFCYMDNGNVRFTDHANAAGQSLRDSAQKVLLKFEQDYGSKLRNSS